MKVSDIKDDSVVYVRNLTTTDINLTVMDNSEKPVLVLIPRSPIPQEVTDVVTSDVLRKDTSFKRLISVGALALVSNKDAERELATDEAKVHLAYLHKSKSTLPAELLSTENDLNISPVDVISSDDFSEIRDELRDLVISEDMDPNDMHAKLMMLDKEAALSRKEMEFVLSAINEQTFFDAYQFLKGKRNSFLSELN